MRKYNISFKEGDKRNKNLLLVRRKPEQQKRKSEGERGERDSQTETERARETEPWGSREEVPFYIWEDTGTLSQTKDL